MEQLCRFNDCQERWARHEPDTAGNREPSAVSEVGVPAYDDVGVDMTGSGVEQRPEVTAPCRNHVVVDRHAEDGFAACELPPADIDRSVPDAVLVRKFE
jgi:hypothetical protein